MQYKKFDINERKCSMTMRVSNDNLRKNAVVFMIAYSIMPFVSRVVSTYLTTYSYMIFSVLFIVLIIFDIKTESLNEVLFNISPFIAYGILTYFTQKDGIVLWGYQFLIFVMPLIIGAYIMNYHIDECKKYSKIIIWCLIITCITTSKGLEAHPEAARWMAMVADSQDSRFAVYNWKNIGGYSFTYTIVLMYPLLVLAFKKGKISFFKTILIAMLAFSCLVLADYTIALILFVITSTLFFLKRQLRPRDVVFFAVVAVIIMIIFSGLLSGIIKNIAKNVDSENIASRLNDIAGGTEGLQKSDDKRLDLYMMSINTFLRHPFGTFLQGGNGTGGHSFILDSLGQYGIFGLVAVIYMYRKIYFLFYQKYRDKEDFGYIVWIFAQAILLSSVNTGMWVEILAFYVPIILCVLYGGDENEKNPLDSEYAT